MAYRFISSQWNALPFKMHVVQDVEIHHETCESAKLFTRVEQSPMWTQHEFEDVWSLMYNGLSLIILALLWRGELTGSWFKLHLTECCDPHIQIFLTVTAHAADIWQRNRRNLKPGDLSLAASHGVKYMRRKWETEDFIPALLVCIPS